MPISAAPPVWVHLTAAIAALLLALVVLVRPKGTRAHVIAGRIWVGVMLLVAIGSFWIQHSGRFSWIHGLSVWVLFALGMALFHVRRYRVTRAAAHRISHAAWMIGTVSGSAVAGLFALAPGRLLHQWMFA